MFHKMFTGRCEYIAIRINGPRIIPLDIYQDALQVAPRDLRAFSHSINLVFDDVHYTNVEFGDLLIALIYHAALGKTIDPSEFNNINITSEDPLIGYLAVLNWSRMFLKNSEAENILKFKIKLCVLRCVGIVKALVCSSGNQCGNNSARIALASKSGIVIPERFTDILLMSRTSDKKFDEKEFDDDLNKYLWTEADKICEEDPDYMRILGFGAECEAALRLVMGEDDVELYCYRKPDMTIYNVFRYGLAGALDADYVVEN